jgi:hypothetical protein
MLHPFRVSRTGLPYVICRQFLGARLPMLLAAHAVRCLTYARQGSEYDRAYDRKSGLGSRQQERPAVDGEWALVLTTPMGKRNAILSLEMSNGKLTGTQGADGQSAEIFDGTVRGNDLFWKVSINSPMPLTLDFEGTIKGEEIAGEMSIDSIGRFSFIGRRA